MKSLSSPPRLARVLGKRARLGAVAAIACAGALAGCGGNDEPEASIPTDAGNAILMHLDQVRAQLDAGNCDGAEDSAQNVRDAIGNLPADVPDDLEEALVKASDNLVEQTQSDCKEKEQVVPPPPEPPTGATGAEGVVP